MGGSVAHMEAPPEFVPSARAFARLRSSGVLRPRSRPRLERRRTHEQGFLILVITAVALAAPAAASAATKTVTMGVTPKQGKVITATAEPDANQFFPGTVKSTRGTRSSSCRTGSTTRTSPRRRKGSSARRFRRRRVRSGRRRWGAFWFGLPTLGLNPALLKSKFGKTVKYTGEKAVNSGLPLANRPKPFKVRFPKAGSSTTSATCTPG